MWVSRWLFQHRISSFETWFIFYKTGLSIQTCWKGPWLTRDSNPGPANAIIILLVWKMSISIHLTAKGPLTCHRRRVIGCNSQMIDIWIGLSSIPGASCRYAQFFKLRVPIWCPTSLVCCFQRTRLHIQQRLSLLKLYFKIYQQKSYLLLVKQLSK
jgi:hypothetical protein